MMAMDLRAASEASADELIKQLNTARTGLTEEEAEDRLARYGPNQVVKEKKATWYGLLLKSYIHPFNILLTVLAFTSFFLGDISGAWVIATLVALSVGIQFMQDFRSRKAAEKLRSMVHTMATVVRQTEKEVPIQNLVPGDIVKMCAGDMVPGDVRILSSKDLFISQASLTGESIPIEKSELAPKKSMESATDLSNMCFMGTEVVSGTAEAVVLQTGTQTFFGSMTKSLVGYRPETSFVKGVKKVSWLIIRFMVIFASLVFILNALTKGDLFLSLLFSISVAVGLTPELLPMIVTTNLAKGVIAMAKKKVIVKELGAIQNFGAMNLLCTDKTGTLTQNRVILERYIDLEGKDSHDLLHYAYLNSLHQTGLKNLMDQAILNHKELEQAAKEYRKIDEIPFDFLRRCMSVIVEAPGHENIMITKGAVDEMISLCAQIQLDGRASPMSPEAAAQAKALAEKLNDEGLRVLALAYKKVPKEQKDFRPSDESGLALMGFLCFLDPPKQTAAEALKQIHTAGVAVKVLTGDNMAIARRICSWVGLDAEHALLGSEIDAMDDDALKRALEKTTLFAKVNPLQKERIIKAFKSMGLTTGYLGDGINDAPALRAADVGISVDSAVDVAKEEADVILLQKSLRILKDGILEGRKTFGNIIKYLKLGLSSNFSNITSILGASILLPFLPMTPVQILLQNFLYDTSQLAIPFDHVDKEFISRPQTWDPKGITRFMVIFGPINSLFDYFTFAVLWFFYSANSPEHQAFFQTGWFVENTITSLFVIYILRTQKIPFIQSRPSKTLVFGTLSIMALSLYLPYSSIGHHFSMVPMPLSYFFWMAGLAFAYCLLAQWLKLWYLRRFQRWL